MRKRQLIVVMITAAVERIVFLKRLEIPAKTRDKGITKNPNAPDGQVKIPAIAKIVARMPQRIPTRSLILSDLAITVHMFF
jgi:hypothetical protein